MYVVLFKRGQAEPGTETRRKSESTTDINDCIEIRTHTQKKNGYQRQA